MDASPSHQLTPPIDLPTALDQLEIDYLTVPTERLLVIFRNAVLNIKIEKETPEGAEQVTIDVLDVSPQSPDPADQLIDQFLKQLETATGTASRSRY